MPSDPRQPIDPQDLALHRPQLLKFAMLQLRNTAQAEDAVQETLVAAIRGVRSLKFDPFFMSPDSRRRRSFEMVIRPAVHFSTSIDADAHRQSAVVPPRSRCVMKSGW